MILGLWQGLVFDSEKKEDDRSSKSSSAAARAPKFIRYDKPFVISSGQRENSRVENNTKKPIGDKCQSLTRKTLIPA